jgi:hypothetical protein
MDMHFGTILDLLVRAVVVIAIGFMADDLRRIRRMMSELVEIARLRK